MTDTATEQSAEDFAAALNDQPANGATSKRENMPEYTMAAVDELPEDYVGGRSKMYYELFAKIAQTPNQWVEVAHFKTSTGATSALKAINDGDREIPQYEGATWELAKRRLPNPTDPTGQKHSKLFARLVVEG